MLALLDSNDSTAAAEILPPDWLMEESFQGLDPQANVRRWIEQLMDAGETAEALRLVGFVLPQKYVVAWGCACLKEIIENSSDDAREVNRAGVALAEHWLQEPTEEHQRSALDFAEAGEFDTAGAWISAAAGWAGGNMAPAGDEFQKVEPRKSLAGEAVVAAILTAAGADAEASKKWLDQSLMRALNSFGDREANR